MSGMNMEFLRQLWPEFDEKGYTDAEAIQWYADAYGQDPQEVAAQFGLIDPDQGDTTRGISSGIDSIQATGYGLAGLAGDTVGLDSVRDWGFEGYKDNMDMVGLRSRDYDNVENWDGVGDVADSAQYWLGYAVPNLATGGVSSYLGKKAASYGVKKRLEDAVDDATRAQLAKELASRELQGSIGGVMAQGVGMELGATYGEAVQRALDEGRSIEDVDLARVYGYGTAAGLLEGGADLLTLGAARMLPTRGLKTAPTNSRTANAAIGATKVGGVEAVTEMAQTGLEQMGAGASYEEANFMDPTSAFAGFVGGGAVGGIGGALQTREVDILNRNRRETAAKNKAAMDLALQESQIKAAEEAKQAAAQAVQDELNNRAAERILGSSNIDSTMPQQGGYQATSFIDNMRSQQREQARLAEQQRRDLEQNFPGGTEVNGNVTVNNLEVAVRMIEAATGETLNLDKKRKRDGLTDAEWVAKNVHNKAIDDLPQTDAVKNRRLLLQMLHEMNTAQMQPNEAPVIQDTAPAEFKFTPAQQGIYEILADNPGLTNKQIADMIGDSESNVSKHIRNMRKRAEQYAADNKVLMSEIAPVFVEVAPDEQTIGINDYVDQQQDEEADSTDESSLTTTDLNTGGMRVRKSAKDSPAIESSKDTKAARESQRFINRNDPMSAPAQKAAEKIWTKKASKVLKSVVPYSSLPPEAKADFAKRVQAAGKDAESSKWAQDNAADVVRLHKKRLNQMDEAKRKARKENKAAPTWDTLDGNQEEAVVDTTKRDANMAKAKRYWDKTRQERPRLPAWEELDDAQQDRWVRAFVDNNGQRPNAVRAAQAIRSKDLDKVADLIASSVSARIESPYFSMMGQGKGGKPKNPTNRTAFMRELTDITGKKAPWRVTVFDTLEEAIAARITDADIGNIRPQGWVVPANPYVEGGSTVSKAYFILENIKKGNERAVIFHEIGAHMGIDNLLSAEQIDNAVDKIIEWADLDDGSKASMYAKAARVRAAKAAPHMQDPVKDYPSEMIAYFIEEAVKDGVDVTQPDGTAVGDFIRKIWAAFKAAYRKFRGENADNLTPQDFVNLAYGAARLENSTLFHGTAAWFRRFNHDFMGSGEGAQAFGWGTYLAERFGIGNDYRETDVKNKDNRKGIRVSDLAKKYPNIARIVGVNNIYGGALRFEISDDAPIVQQAGVTKVRGYKISTRDGRVAKQTSFVPLFELSNVELPGVKDSEDAPLFSWAEIDEIDALVSGIKKKFGKNEGHLYRVDYAFSEEELLDHDELVSTQPTIMDAWNSFPEHIRDAVMELENTNEELDITGEALYDALSHLQRTEGMLEEYVPQEKYDQAQKTSGNNRGNYQRERTVANAVTSAFLYEHGVKGIKFLDNKSRGKRTLLNDNLDTTIADTPYLLGMINDESTKFLSERGLMVLYMKKPDGTIKDVVISTKSELTTRKGADGERRPIRVFPLGSQMSYRLMDLYTDAEATTKLDVDEARLQSEIEEARKYKSDGLTRNKIIFDDRDIIRVADNPGSNMDSGAIRFSISDDVRGLSNYVKPTGKAKEYKNKLVAALKRSTADLGPKSMTLATLAETYGDRLKTLLEYYNNSSLMEAMQVGLQIEGHKIAAKWRALDSYSRKELGLIMKAATMLDFHVDKSFADEANKHLKTFTIEMQEAQRRYKNLVTRTPEAAEVYAEARDKMMKDWLQRGELYKSMVARTYDDLIMKSKSEEEKKRLTKERDNYMKETNNLLSSVHVYFPLRRFGDFIVQGKSAELIDIETQLESEGLSASERKKLHSKYVKMKKQPKHYVVSAREKESQAQALADDLKGYAKVSVTISDKADPKQKDITKRGVEKLKEYMTANVSPTERAKIETILDEMYVAQMPEGNALGAELQRQGIAGADEDMLRAFASTVEKNAFYMSRFKYSDLLTENLLAMKTDAREHESGKDTTLEKVYREVKLRREADLDYIETPFVNGVARISGMWHLVSPSYWTINMSQPWFIGAPVLAGEFGMKDSVKEMATAFADSGKIVMNTIKPNAMNGSDKAGWTPFNDVDPSILPDVAERDLIQTLMQRGRIDINVTHDLGVMSRGGSDLLSKASTISMWPAHQIEVSNRTMVALAAFRLAKKRGMSTLEAVEVADRMVIDSQIDYSSVNAPRLLKANALGGYGKLIFQFRKYQHAMLQLLIKNFIKAYGGDKHARATFGYLLGAQAVTAGVVGLPLSNVLLMIANSLIDDDDEDGDALTQMRNALADNFGSTVADMIVKGAPAGIGMDISKRTGMGELFSLVPFMRTDANTGKEAMGNFMVAAGGAWMSLPVGMLDAIEFAGDGQLWRAAESIMPKAFKDVSKAARYADEGLRGRNKQENIDSDAFSYWDLAQRALGFTPLTESNYYDAKNAVYKVENAIGDRRSRLLRDYAVARMDGDSREAARVRREISKFNRDHPKFRIKRSTINKSVKNRRNSRRERVNGYNLGNPNEKLPQLIRFLD